MAQPIDLYYWPTPNGWKTTIILEETGLPYRLVPVNITSGDQFEEEFLRISPNNKIPAIIDPEGPDGEPMSLSESGAILIYLAEKAREFLPETPRDKYLVLQWLMFQMGHVGRQRRRTSGRRSASLFVRLWRAFPGPWALPGRRICDHLGSAPARPRISRRSARAIERF